MLREAEVFRLGGVLIGTVAYRTLGNALGVELDEHIAVVLEALQGIAGLGEAIQAAQGAVLAVPALDQVGLHPAQADRAAGRRARYAPDRTGSETRGSARRQARVVT